MYLFADNLEVLPDHGSPTSSSPNTSDILPTSNQNLSSTISSNIISTTNDNTPGSSWYIDREPSDIGPDRPTSGNETNKISHVGSTNEVSKNKKLNNSKKPVKKVAQRKLKKSGILAIDVIKPSVYITADDKVPTYLTTSEESRGSVLLLNNIEFIIAKKKRIGADIDHINITKLFDEMGFRVSSHQNKTAKVR